MTIIRQTYPTWAAYDRAEQEAEDKGEAIAERAIEIIDSMMDTTDNTYAAERGEGVIEANADGLDVLLVTHYKELPDPIRELIDSKWEREAEIEAERQIDKDWGF